MAKDVLVIGETEASFILKSIVSALEQHSYDVRFSFAKVDDLCIHKAVPDFIIICGGDYLDSCTEALIYLKDFCMEHEKKVYTVGYPDEVEIVKRVMSEGLIQRHFGRPLDLDALVTEFEEAVKEAEADNLKKHILVVDDSGIMLRTIKSWLSSNYRVSMAVSAAMAISFLASNKPDLILLDYDMPICSGPQFLQMIRSEISTRDIPVIFLTAKGDKKSITEVLDLKPDGYLLKTMKPMEILDAINTFFAKRKVHNM